jgi:hypothetical protein
MTRIAADINLSVAQAFRTTLHLCLANEKRGPSRHGEPLWNQPAANDTKVNLPRNSVALLVIESLNLLNSNRF